MRPEKHGSFSVLRFQFDTRPTRCVPVKAENVNGTRDLHGCTRRKGIRRRSVVNFQTSLHEIRCRRLVLDAHLNRRKPKFRRPRLGRFFFQKRPLRYSRNTSMKQLYAHSSYSPPVRFKLAVYPVFSQGQNKKIPFPPIGLLRRHLHGSSYQCTFKRKTIRNSRESKGKTYRKKTRDKGGTTLVSETE